MTNNTTIINHNDCPGQDVLNVLSTKWVPGIFKVVARGPARFSELVKSLPGSSKQSISVALQQLEKFRLVEKTIVKQKPLHIEYSLTDSGRAMLNVFAELSKASALMTREAEPMLA